MTVVVGTSSATWTSNNSRGDLPRRPCVGTARKRYLPNYGVFDENRYFMPSAQTACSRAATVFGVNVCEDIWLPGGPSEEQVDPRRRRGDPELSPRPTTPARRTSAGA
jgi:NAD+ synthase (glutamine-hydrolysing)